MVAAKKHLREQKSLSKIIFYRISQLVGFVLGARIFVTILLTFALYVSTFFLFNQEESLKEFVFDYKVHGIIFCSVLSILAGGIINQFYDRERDQVTKPFRTKIQNFIKQKYFLYAYILLNIITLTLAVFISVRVLIFFLIYQFLMWYYSHKLNKLLILNNLTFVALTLYPFFGMLVYYKTFTINIMVMALFLLLILLTIDIIKDMLTRNADKIFGYSTISNQLGMEVAKRVVLFLLMGLILISSVLINKLGYHRIIGWYFFTGIPVFIWSLYLLFSNKKNAKFITHNLLRIWVFVGIVMMLIDGIFLKS